MPQPNILLIICHDLGRHVGCYGRAPIASPALDRLASQGLRCDGHFCTAPSCSPSRGSLLTGRYPHANGLLGLVNLGWDLPAAEATLPQLLSAAGYQTHLFGLQHERRDASTLGYAHLHQEGGAGCTQVAAEVARFLSGAPRQPFYACAGVMEVHRPFVRAGLESEAVASAYLPVLPPDGTPVYQPPYLPADPIVQREMAGFGALVARLDEAVGAMLAALDASGLAEETLVIFTTDHGIDMPRAKGTLYDPGLETALLVRWPGRVRPGSVSTALSSHVDLLPTLLEVAGAPIPAPVQGQSRLPHWLARASGSGRDAIYAEKTHHCQYDPMRAVRTARAKYIHNWGPLRALELPADGEMDTLASVPGLYVTRRPLAELYDLAADPLEQRNLCGNPAYADVEAELRARLRAWMAETGDPLLDGWMPVPKYL